VWASVDDIMTFLSEHVFLRYNMVTRRTEVHPLTQGNSVEVGDDGLLRLVDAPAYKEFSTDPKDPRYWQPITDRIVNTLWKDMSKQESVRIQDIHRIIDSDYVPAYDPFRSYLDSLPPWNGTDDYIMELSLSVNVKGDADEQIRFYQYLRKWLVAMVAGWVDDDVVNNVILVLIGPQGSYKTTWFNYLLPPPIRQYFYTKTNANRMGRDDLLTLAQYGLVCCEELDTMRPSELNQLKAAVTMPSIDERAAYAHYHEHRRHIASFCGTGNNVQFLSDPTGNRRWLPFEVESIDSPRDKPFNYDGIYAQAYRLYRDGFTFWFTQDEVRQLARHNAYYEAPKLEHELVDIYFRPPREGELGEFMPIARAMQIIGGSLSQKLSDRKLNHAFKDLGFDYHRTTSSRGFVVVRRSDMEIKERQTEQLLMTQ
jgi:predicted P-loop ATPase